MSGAIYRVGWAHEPPNSTVGGQVANQVGSQAAAAILAAAHYRDLIGAGQHIDISAHEGMAVVDWDALPRYATGGGIIPRGAMPGAVGRPGASGFHARRIWSAQDRKVRFVLTHVLQAAKEWSLFVSWLESHGMAAGLTDPVWLDLDYRFAHLHRVEEVAEAFLKTLSAHQAMEEGQDRGIQVMAFGRIHELLEDPQLAGEGFFVPVEHPALDDTLVYPGGPYRFSETPWRIERTAPPLGEHNIEVYRGEMGLSNAELVTLKQAGVI
jgi:crotonobetainyl-CoA:carnitine CoA-transferase CaiB-like acyl-CoA transferase